MKQPNIVMFMADQLIPMMTSPYGHPTAITPNMQKLADQGHLFRNVYSTCPVCVPARCSMLTGKYCASTGCYDNGSIFPADEPSLNHYLNIAGYDTVLCGKAHFVGPDQEHGFSTRLMTNIYPSNFAFLPSKKHGKRLAHAHPIAIDYLGENTGVRQWSMELDYDEEVICRAVRYLSTKCSSPSASAQEVQPPRDDKPFFLNVSINHPHEPFHVLQKYWDLYENREIPIPQYPDKLEESYTSMDRELIALHTRNGEVSPDQIGDPGSLRRVYRSYLAAVSYVDDKLGRVMRAIDEFGLADSTIFIMISDHGDMLCQRKMVQKRVFYEYSTRIPVIVSVPRGIGLDALSGSRTIEDPASITDIMPTILDLVGVQDCLPMDGRSLRPRIEGRSDPERYVFCENYSEGVSAPCVMVRKGKYKYSWIHNGEEAQLFDLEEDPGEWNNLAGSRQYRQVEQELSAVIRRHFNVDEIRQKVGISYEKRQVIKESMRITGLPKWDYAPKPDIGNLYWQNKV